jgi:aspartate carbamoyltransferase
MEASQNPFLSTYQPVPLNGDFRAKHIISIDQFSPVDLQILFDATHSIRRRVLTQDRGLSALCSGQVLASLFFEASTRTDMSFQAAMRRLGGNIIAASNGVRFSSVYKGEDLPDTIRAAGCYADVIVLRHPQVGSCYEAAYYLDMLNERIENPTTLINAGDGAGEHPTQALLDLFTIIDQKKSLDNLTITMVGDLRYGRTVHSLAKLMARYDLEHTSVCLVAPESLRMPPPLVELLEAGKVHVYQTTDLTTVIRDTDVLYWTRVQEERFQDNPEEYEAIKDAFILTPALLSQAKEDSILMHPLPRKHEMGTQADHDILDRDPRAVYFEQMENGMFVRMALLARVLSGAYV